MPEKTDFEKLMREAGVSKDSVIVVTSKGHSNKDITMSTRVYWQLKYFGHDAVAILDGGTALWIKNGHKVSSEVAKPVKGNWAVTAERKEMLATIKEVGDAVVAAKIQLVDTRTVSEYIGTFSKAYVYDQGHLSGAKNFPNELLTGPKLSARFHSLDTFKKLVKKLKIDTKAETIVYCNSGHLASGSWFVLSELLGNKNVKLYDGSMHQWTIEKRPLVKM